MHVFNHKQYQRYRSLRYTVFMSKPISLIGLEIAGYIKERHAAQIRASQIKPVLAIVSNSSEASVQIYLRVKQRYAEDIGAEVRLIQTQAADIADHIVKLNADKSVHGIIIQLPFEGLARPQEIFNTIDPSKDVDALGLGLYDPPTATAIFWLLAGFNINLNGQEIVIVGNGRLVGQPIVQALKSMDLPYTIIDENTHNPQEIVAPADILISGVGKPEIIQSSWLKPGCVVVDAGIASEAGELKGDVEQTARLRNDISITPIKGGVGPLTVTALFENLLRAAHV